MSAQLRTGSLARLNNYIGVAIAAANHLRGTAFVPKHDEKPFGPVGVVR
jgi:hypothetical protein